MDLQTQIDELKKRMDDNEVSHSFNTDLESAIRERIKPLSSTGTTSAVNSPSTFSSFNVIVPAAASGAIAVKIGNVTYNLLYK